MAGLVTGLTSFGSNLIAVPLLAFVYPARDSILTGCLAAAMIFSGLAVLYWRSIAWRDTLLLVLCAFAGIPAGSWFLKSAGPGALLLGAGFALCLFLAWQFAATLLRRSSKPVGQWFALPMGLLSGILMAGVGMGGPPLVLYAFLRNFDKQEAISTINAASFGIMLAVLPDQYLSGMFDTGLLKLGLCGGLAGICGIIFSLPLVKRLDLGFFRKLLLLMLGLSALALLWRGLGTP